MQYIVLQTFLKKGWIYIRFAWPIISELVDHGFDGDGLTRSDSHHIIDVLYNKLEENNAKES